MVLAGGGEHDDGDLGVAEHGELPRLLHDPRAALGVGDLPVGRVLDPLNLDLAAPHLVGILGQLLKMLGYSCCCCRSFTGEESRAVEKKWGGE